MPVSERARLNSLWEKHRDYEVTLNQKLISSLGLIPDKTFFKCGGLNQPFIFYMTSMSGARIISKLNDETLLKINESKGKISLMYFFRVNNQIVSFYINSKLTSFDIYDSGDDNLYYIGVEYINRPPDIFIDILGSYIEKQVSLQKRAEERVVLGKNSMETFLFNAGNGKRCFLTEISIFSAKVLIVGQQREFGPGNSVMLLMKSIELEGLGEMVGVIARVELINMEEGLFSVIINFDQEKVPPLYKMWVAQCIETIKLKKV